MSSNPFARPSSSPILSVTRAADGTPTSVMPRTPRQPVREQTPLEIKRAAGRVVAIRQSDLLVALAAMDFPRPPLHRRVLNAARAGWAAAVRSWRTI